MPVITKAELVEAAAKAGGISRSAASVAVNAVFDKIVTSVARGNRVALVGFGAFVPRKRSGRSGRNPGNGSEIRIPARTVPAFTPGQAFREAVDRRR